MDDECKLFVNDAFFFIILLFFDSLTWNDWNMISFPPQRYCFFYEYVHINAEKCFSENSFMKILLVYTIIQFMQLCRNCSLWQIAVPIIISNGNPIACEGSGDFSFCLWTPLLFVAQIFRCKGMKPSSDGLGFHCQQAKIFLIISWWAYFRQLATHLPIVMRRTATFCGHRKINSRTARSKGSKPKGKN